MKANIEHLVDEAALCETCWGTGYTESVSINWTEAQFEEFSCPDCSNEEE